MTTQQSNILPISEQDFITLSSGALSKYFIYNKTKSWLFKKDNKYFFERQDKNYLIYKSNQFNTFQEAKEAFEKDGPSVCNILIG